MAPADAHTRRAWLRGVGAAALGALVAPRTRAADAPPASGLRFADQPGGRVALLEAGRPVLAYNWADQSKDGVPADRTRSCYVHPLFGLDGEELSDDFPRDHYHHRGLFWTWQRMKADGQAVDLWTIKGIRQHFGRWIERREGETAATLAVENTWIVDGRPPCAKETVRLTVHRAEAAGRAADVELRLEALSGPVELLGAEGKGYGGLGLRFAPREETVVTSAAGPQAKDSDRVPSPWADLSARFAGRKEPSGAAIFVHPANPGFPNGWTLRHYGFLGPCWPGLEPYVLEPGKPVTLKYRVWVHRGDAAAGKVAEAWEAYRAASAPGGPDPV